MVSRLRLVGGGEFMKHVLLGQEHLNSEAEVNWVISMMDGKRVEILITCLKPSISTHLSSARLLFNLLENTVRLKTTTQNGIAQMMVNLFL